MELRRVGIFEHDICLSAATQHHRMADRYVPSGLRLGLHDHSLVARLAPSPGLSCSDMQADCPRHLPHEEIDEGHKDEFEKSQQEGRHYAAVSYTSRKVNGNGPKVTTEPVVRSRGAWAEAPLTRVPFADPRSTTQTSPASLHRSAWVRLTPGSPMVMSEVSARPIPHGVSRASARV